MSILFGNASNLTSLGSPKAINQNKTTIINMCNVMVKSPLIAFLIVLMISGLAFVGSSHFVAAQSYANAVNVSGTITSDTTWAFTNSNYYNFTGDVTVANGVTLTIEPGASIRVNTVYTLQVDGTVHAVGTSNDPIAFGTTVSDNYIGGTITFSQSSNSWNAETGSGCIIQNAEFSPSFYINIINTSPDISQNQFYGNIAVSGGSPVISNNTLNTQGGHQWGDIVSVNGGSPLISNNTISGLAANGNGPSTPGGVSLEGTNNALVTDNQFNGDFSTAAIVISSGTPLIERNFITSDTVIDGVNYNNAPVGMTIYGDASPVIENNTIAENAIGLNIYDSSGSPSPTITNNNIEGNTQYNIYLGEQGVLGSTAGNINAANNWWGTTDTSIINQTIYDNKNNNNLGTVTFTPILTSMNPDAAPNPNAPITTLSPTLTSSPVPSSTSTGSPATSPNQLNTQATPQLVFYGIIAVLAVVIVVLLIAMAALHKRAKTLRAR